MGFDAKVGSVSVEDKPIFSGRVKALLVNKTFAADNGALSPGQIVANNAAGAGIPAEVVADTDMTGTVNGTNKVFTHDHGRAICPGSVAINHGDQDVVDDGFGNLIGDGSGTVTYATGEMSVTLDTAPANESGSPTVSFDDDPDSILETQIDTDNEQLEGSVGVFGSAIKANSFMKDDAAISSAVINRLRLKGVYFE